MRAREQLVALYQEWHRLTIEEGKAVEASSWTQVNDCQDAKFALQPRIIDASELMHAEWEAIPAQRLSDEPFIRQVVGELVEMESHICQRIATRRREAEDEHRSISETGNRLRRLHSAYGSSRRSAWSSYS